MATHEFMAQIEEVEIVVDGAPVMYAFDTNVEIEISSGEGALGVGIVKHITVRGARKPVMHIGPGHPWFHDTALELVRRKDFKSAVHDEWYDVFGVGAVA